MLSISNKSVLFATAALLGAITSVATLMPVRTVVAQTGNACGEVPNPAGVYAFAVEGFNDGGESNSLTINNFYPLSGAGTVTFTPSTPGASSGTVSRRFFLNFGGAVFSPPITDSAPYSQSADCSFSANFTDAGEIWDFITAAEGMQVKFFVEAPGSVVAGTMNRQRNFHNH